MYEIIVILYATIAEVRALIRGKYTSTIYLLGHGVGTRLFLIIMSFSYMILSFVWCFNPSVWVKGAGFTLVAMSVATQLLKYEDNRLWVRLNAMTCIACLGLVGFLKTKGIIWM